MKTSLFVLMMLIPFAMLSQEDSTKVSLGFLQNVESQLRELDRRRQENIANDLIIAKYKSANEKLREAGQIKDQRISLLQNSLDQALQLYEIEQKEKRKNTWFIDILKILGALGVGFTLGSVF